ncbi:EAL domain-containing protein [Aliihoeflea aestuarii]|uniref:EAL domain-containing protein n=1 Tax=Aliihoeflea aestuarii TaxID=453840 RepID=UPI002094C5DC|nr:EAL domain-containing protein [Aliihoeflea aestuarii]MCO6392027.1 EAL domain-containing protein [Aliihoeflea aestuarii]
MGPLASGALPADPVTELNLRILKLENRLQRERSARLQAEEIAERGLRDLYERQRQLELLEAITAKANTERMAGETFSFAIDAVCRHTGWPFGTVHLMDDTDGRLKPSGMWHAADAEKLKPFIERTQATRFASGEGLPGRVLAKGSAVWIDNVALDPTLPRCHVAAACGLHAAFAFPILVGPAVCAVMEFFHRDPQDIDEQLLKVMAQIGTQLGRVIERQRAEEKLIHDATHDPLTGLPNRLLFSDRLERAVAMKSRRSGSDYAVLFIDLDRFKLVNDSLGHGAGDTLLIEIAERFSTVLEHAGDDDMLATLARLGGDEFTVLLEGVVDTGKAVEFAGRLLQALSRPIDVGGQNIYASASIGVAAHTDDYSHVADVMRDADLAMYRAKSAGRSRVEVFDRSLHEIAAARLALESDLRDALHNREFVLHYQPIVTLEDGSITGFEALVRWKRPGVENLVSPNEFISLAEDTGLIVFLGDWIMREAFATLVAWQEQGSATGEMTVSVNVSPRQFHQPDFLEKVLAAIRDTGIAKSCVRLEITESVPVVDAERTIEIIKALRHVGVRVSIDDFGTGYSSLSYLHNLPCDVLKIDRSFVMSLEEREDGHEIVRTILDLARNMGMDVVAEGTETADHVRILKELGCGSAQGFFFSRPIDADAARALLDSRVQAARTIAQ